MIPPSLQKEPILLITPEMRVSASRPEEKSVLSRALHVWPTLM